MGMWVIVNNCSEGLDYKSMGKCFSGLAQTGAWGCFDEFNRINIEVLSVVAQQILCILSAISQKQKRFVFEGKEVFHRKKVMSLQTRQRKIKLAALDKRVDNFFLS